MSAQAWRTDLLGAVEHEAIVTFAVLLRAHSPVLTKPQWNEVLYAIDSLAEHGQVERAVALVHACQAEASRIGNDYVARAATYFEGEIYRGRDTGRALAAYRLVVQMGRARPTSSSL